MEIIDKPKCVDLGKRVKIRCHENKWILASTILGIMLDHELINRWLFIILVHFNHHGGE